MSGLNMNRRKFIGALGLGTAHLLFSNPLYAADTRFSSLDPLQKVTLGNSGIQTTLLGMGTGVHATNRSSFLTRQDEAKSLELLHHAYEKGIRYFDLADTYGTHQMLAKAMEKMDRKELTITTKIWERGGGIPENERPPADVVVDRFRKELNTDYIDLVQLHCMVDDNWTDSMKAQMDILENLKAKGIIRGHGVSVHSLPAMKAALESSWVDVIHVRINPYGIAMDKPDPQEVVEVIHQLHNSGKGVIGMKLVGDGKLQNDSEKIDNALNFVLGLGSVDMMIIGFEEKEQIDNYIGRTQKALAKLHN
ncbi:aldo/keto reductase [Maribellus luteus]|uniref:Aldo/keto reductase n=2 Tax=Maribellus luteus TaxID=2305463 RepID=A0A399SY92_9BACT|nr:aldo/keto reductase [Maribellus luteus]